MLDVYKRQRKYLLILAAGFVNTLMPGEDTLISKGFSIEEAKNTTEAFEDFCKKYYDEIEALRIIYNNEGEPITYSMLKDLENRLKMANNHFTSKQLWNSYAIVNPKVVRRSTTKEESDALDVYKRQLYFIALHIRVVPPLFSLFVECPLSDTRC